MSKKVMFLSLIGLLMAVFSVQTALAADPNWQAKQKKWFEQIGIKPGDMIDQSNWQKVQNYLPETVAGYVKKGEFVLKIAEFKYDYGMDEAWDKASLANKGKYGLGKNKEIIDLATGKFPTYIYGKPFPELKSDDPDLGIKIMHTKTVEEGRAGHMDQYCTTTFIGEKGLERILYDRVMYYWYWARPDGEKPNPNKFKWMEIVGILEPYDLAGTWILTHRPLDGTADRGGTYVPALRRVRKTSGTNRSDPFFGSDFVNDDAGGWGGQNETMSWKVIGEKLILIPMANWQLETPDILVKDPNGMWKNQGYHQQVWGYNDKNWKGAKWAPMPAYTSWVPRECYLIEATPLDPYYNYGKCVYYVDKEALVPVIKITRNKAGEHWKTLLISQFTQQFGEDKKKIIDQQGWYIVIDDKRRHAGHCAARDHFEKWDFPIMIMDPNEKPEDFTFEKIATRSK